MKKQKHSPTLELTAAIKRLNRQRRKKMNEIFKLTRGKEYPEIKKLLCGKLIANGAFRKVYEYKHDKDYYVVKIDCSARSTMFANVTEWRNYINYCESPIGKWLCPIEAINETGSVMIMRRATFKNKFSEYPKKLPLVFSDFKIENYGWVDGRFVCVDYSTLWINDDDRNKRNVRWWTVNGKIKNK